MVIKLKKDVIRFYEGKAQKIMIGQYYLEHKRVFIPHTSTFMANKIKNVYRTSYIVSRCV